MKNFSYYFEEEVEGRGGRGRMSGEREAIKVTLKNILKKR